MPTTSTWALPYPALSDAPNSPQQVQALADKVNTYLGKPFVCSSTTRPAGVIGLSIFETDTGKVLYYYDPPGAAPVGWYQLWNVPWGGLSVVNTISGSAGANGGFATVMVTGDLTFTPGRLVRVEFSGPFDNPNEGSTILQFDLLTSANVYDRTLVQRRLPHGASPRNFNFFHGARAEDLGAVTRKVNIAAASPGVFLTNFAAGGTGAQLTVTDVGPA